MSLLRPVFVVQVMTVSDPMTSNVSLKEPMGFKILHLFCPQWSYHVSKGHLVIEDKKAVPVKQVSKKFLLNSDYRFRNRISFFLRSARHAWYNG